VLGFLSVSTAERSPTSHASARFQSRAGFSECLDVIVVSGCGLATVSFNPVLGFLSVSTTLFEDTEVKDLFQSRAGFSECLDRSELRDLSSIGDVSIPCWVF